MTAVVFDFDGVLADTEALHLKAFQEAFAARGWTLTDAAYAASAWRRASPPRGRS